MNHRIVATIFAVSVGAVAAAVHAEPQPSLPASAFVIDATVPTTVSLLPDATIVLQPTRVGVIGDHGIDWQRFAKGLKQAAQQDPDRRFAFAEVFGTLDNLWLESAMSTRAGNMSKFFHYDAKKGWREQWAHGASKLLYVMEIITTATGTIAHWEAPDFSDARTAKVMPPGGHWWVADGMTLPPLETKDFVIERMLPFKDGEMWAMGYVRKTAEPSAKSMVAWQLHRWKPDGTIAIDPLDEQPASILADDPQNAVLAMHDKFLRFDGTTWQPLPWVGKAIGGELHRAKDGSLWSVLITGSGTVVERRLPDGTVQNLTPSSDWLAIDRVYGIEVGAPWALLQTGHLAYLSNRHGTWVEMLMPAPPKADPKSDTSTLANNIAVRSANDVWFSTSYEGSGTNDPQHWAVLHLTTAPE